MRYAILFLAFLSACYTEPVSRSETNNPDINVGLLFEHEGCRVYRFNDGNTHYYAVCDRNRTSQMSDVHTESCGKNCSRTVRKELMTVWAGDATP